MAYPLLLKTDRCILYFTLLLFTLPTFTIYIYNYAYLEDFLQVNFSYILL